MSSNNTRLLANRYRLTELVGAGAMGQVYRAEDTLLGSVSVAVKFLSQTLLNQKMRDRFEQEATVSALLGEESIHIVRVRDYGVDDNNVPFYVMEFLEGENLGDSLQYGPFDLPRFFKIARQICLGLKCAHQGITFKGQLCPIIHRDIKPSNILILADASLGELVKILDFGIAKLIQSNETQTHSFMGTLAYCSPEQMEGQELDSRSDIYSLGVMMYEMLTNDMPITPEISSFGGWYKAHHEFEPKVFPANLGLPSDLKQLVSQCLSKLPQDRPQSTKEILSALEHFEQGYSDSSTNIVPIPTAPRQPPTTSEDPTCTFVLSPDDICLHTAWPEDKPHQKIVFPRLIHTPQGTIVGLCAMLESQEISNRLSCTRYNQFLLLESPHPMLLWVTALYSHQYGVRWLPCYLDLKTNLGQQVVRILAQLGAYRILLYALKEPQQPKGTLATTIAANQCKYLNNWADASKVIHTSQPQASKKLLKQEFERLKPKILLKLEAVYNSKEETISSY